MMARPEGAQAASSTSFAQAALRAATCARSAVAHRSCSTARFHAQVSRRLSCRCRRARSGKRLRQLSRQTLRHPVCWLRRCASSGPMSTASCGACASGQTHRTPRKAARGPRHRSRRPHKMTSEISTAQAIALKHRNAAVATSGTSFEADKAHHDTCVTWLHI
jgi:hypothetical protein